jgi:FkbM family methyltransferase
MNSHIKKTFKKTFRRIGLEISQAKKSPENTLLGLRKIPIQTVIDIGANTGQFARYISSIFQEATIYSFEPLPGPFFKLKSWASKNQRVIPMNIAIGNESGKIKMHFHKDHPASSSILKTTHTTETLYPKTQNQNEIIVDQMTLDDAASLINIQGNLLIKMDVQGYEDRVIDGGKALFSKAIACITEISLIKLYHNQATFESISNRMTHFGLFYSGNLKQVYSDDGACIYLDALYAKAPLCSINLRP